MNFELREQMLRAALEQRTNEVTEYQVNIDNCVLALEAIRCEEGMGDFRDQLRNLLDTSRHEQRKAQIMLDVVKAQVEQLAC